MSRLDELIKELCPNGVEYKSIADIFDTITDYTAAGSFKTIADNVKYYKEENYAQLIRTTDLKSNFLDKTNFVYVDENAFKFLWRVNLNENSLIMPNIGNCGEIYFVTKDLFPNENNVLGPNAILLKTKIYNIKYFYYYFHIKIFQKQLEKITSNTGQTKFNKTDLKKILVPVPPLEVQDEIVRILDNYTKSVEELKEKLNKELIARKKQYSWYRDYLLKFENKVEIVKLGSIVEVYDGTHQTPDYKTSGIPFVSVENIDSIYSTEKYVSEEDFEKNYKIKPRIDDVFMTRIGTVGKCAIVTKNIPLAYYVSLALLRPNKNKIDARYLKYIIESGVGRKELNKRILFTAVPIKINKSDIDKIEIPLPPLEVQKRIVEVLDNFEKICNDLNIGLPAEIEARQKQYEFYRNYLLTFEEKSRQAILACELASLRSKQQAQNLIKILQYVYGYVEVRLANIGSIVRGNGLQKRDFTEEGVGCIHYGQIYTKYGMVAEKTISFVEESLAEKLRKVEKGDIIFAVTSENIEDLCKCVVWLGEEEIVTGGHTAILKHNQNSKFLAYYFQTEAFHNQKRKLATGTKVIDVTATKLEEIIIPLPPLEEQQRIVEILDRFDKLCNDISEGLPAEIEARQKQYEYYREKLLSFKKI